MKNFLDLCQERFSARKFTGEPVSAEDINYVKEAIRLAPSAANRQPWKFLFVVSDKAKRALQECYPGEWFKTASMYVVAMKDSSACWVRKEDGKPHADIDLAIAVEHLCLAAADRGLGTCWVCHYDIRKVAELFPVDGFEAVAIVPMGHIASDCPRPLKNRKESVEIFETL